MKTNFTLKISIGTFFKIGAAIFRPFLLIIIVLGLGINGNAQPGGYAWRLQGNNNFGDAYILSNNVPTTGILSATITAGGTAEAYLIEWDNYANKWSNTNTPKNVVTTFYWGGGFNQGPDGWVTAGIFSGKRYTLQISGLDYSDRQGVIMETDNMPVSFAASNPVTDLSSICAGSAANISITLAGAKSAQEKVFVRYSSTSNFTSSKVVQASGSGSNWSTATASIPGTDNVSGTIYYYAYSTTVASNNSTYHDLVTLKFGNNGGLNYSYTITPSTIFYQDNDNDGFGNPSVSENGCVPLMGFVTNNTDCNDNDNLEKPGQVWYKDNDLDGYPDLSFSSVTQCARPVGYRVQGELLSITLNDCNDAVALINPVTIWYLDNDHDGFCTGPAIQQCESPGAGYRYEGLISCGDCDDNNPAITGFVICLNGTIAGATSVLCYSDFTIKLTAYATGGTAPYTYLWNTGATTAVINGAGAGTYSVTISDAGGQTKVVNHTITQPDPVSGTMVITHQKCLDPDKGSIEVTASGGTPGYTYALNFGTFGASNLFEVLNPAKYTVNIKDANGCQGKLTALVKQLGSSMTMTAVRVGINDCGMTGSITATAADGVAPIVYSLGGGAVQPSGEFTGLAGGTYSITATDAIGCTITRNYAVSDNGKDAYENNNAKGAAVFINPNQQIIARIGTATDQDWYKFNTGLGGNFNVTLTLGSGSELFELRNSADVEVVPTSSAPGIKSYNLPGGSVYRIKVTGPQSYICYDLKVVPVLFGGSVEMLTSKVISPEGIGELKAQPFPNPHNGTFILQIESPVAGKGSIVLYDLQGRTIVTREESLRAGTNQVRFSNLQPINYFYRVMVGGKGTSGKVFKQ